MRPATVASANALVASFEVWCRRAICLATSVAVTATARMVPEVEMHLIHLS